MPVRERKRKTCICCDVTPSVGTSSESQNKRKRRRAQNAKPVSKTIEKPKRKPERPTLLLASTQQEAASQSPVTPTVSPQQSATTTTETVPSCVESSSNAQCLVLSNLFAGESKISEDTVFVSAEQSTRTFRQRTSRTINGVNTIHTFVKEVTFTITSQQVKSVGQKVLSSENEPMCSRTKETVPELVSFGCAKSKVARKKRTCLSKSVFILESDSLDSSDSDLELSSAPEVATKGPTKSVFNLKSDSSDSSDSETDESSACNLSSANAKPTVAPNKLSKSVFILSDSSDSSDSSDNETEESSATLNPKAVPEVVSESRPLSSKNVFIFESSSSSDSETDDEYLSVFTGLGKSNTNTGYRPFFWNTFTDCVTETGEKCKKHEDMKKRRCKCGGWEPCSKRVIPSPCHREMEKILEAYLTDSGPKEYGIIQEVNTGNHGCNPCIYLYNQELLTICNRQQTNLRLNRTFNLGPCFVTVFVFRNSNLLYNKSSKDSKAYGPLMIGPVMLHFDKAPETYTRFFEHVRDRFDIATTPMSDAAIKDRYGVQKRDYKITKVLRKVFGKNMSIAGIHHVPIHLHTELRRRVRCTSHVRLAIDGVYDKYFEQRRETKQVLRGISEIWSLRQRAGAYLEKLGLSSAPEILQALDELSVEC